MEVKMKLNNMTLKALERLCWISINEYELGECGYVFNVVIYLTSEHGKAVGFVVKVTRDDEDTGINYYAFDDGQDAYAFIDSQKKMLEIITKQRG